MASGLLVKAPSVSPVTPGGPTFIHLSTDPAHISASSGEGDLVGYLSCDGATNGFGAVYTFVESPTKWRTVGILLERGALGTLTPGTQEVTTIKVTDTNGNTFTQAFTIQIDTAPTSISITPNEATIADTDPAGTRVGILNTFGGAAPYTYTSLSDTRFDIEVAGSASYLIRSATGTLTFGLIVHPTIRVTDSNSATYDQVIDVTVVHPALPAFDWQTVPTKPAALITLEWTGPNNPLTNPTLVQSTWCSEGAAGSWKLHVVSDPDAVFGSIDNFSVADTQTAINTVMAICRPSPSAAPVYPQGARIRYPQGYFNVKGVRIGQNFSGAAYDYSGVNVTLEFAGEDAGTPPTPLTYLRLQQGAVTDGFTIDDNTYSATILIDNFKMANFPSELAIAVTNSSVGTTTYGQSFPGGGNVFTGAHGIIILRGGLVCINKAHLEHIGNDGITISNTYENELRNNLTLLVFDTRAVCCGGHGSGESHNYYTHSAKRIVFIGNDSSDSSAHANKLDDDRFDVLDSVWSGKTRLEFYLNGTNSAVLSAYGNAAAPINFTGNERGYFRGNLIRPTYNTSGTTAFDETSRRNLPMETNAGAPNSLPALFQPAGSHTGLPSRTIKMVNGGANGSTSLAGSAGNYAETYTIPGTAFIDVLYAATIDLTQGTKVNNAPYFNVKTVTTITSYTKVSTAPAAGQYSVSSAGRFTFNSADIGKNATIQYSAITPSGATQITFSNTSYLVLFNGGPAINSIQDTTTNGINVQFLLDDGSLYDHPATRIGGTDLTSNGWPSVVNQVPINIILQLSVPIPAGRSVLINTPTLLKASTALWDYPAVDSSCSKWNNPADPNYYWARVRDIYGILDPTKQADTIGDNALFMYAEDNFIVPLSNDRGTQTYFYNQHRDFMLTYFDNQVDLNMNLPLAPLDATDGSWPHLSSMGKYDGNLHYHGGGKYVPILGNDGVETVSVLPGGTHGIRGSDVVRNQCLVVKNHGSYQGHLVNKVGFVFNTASSDADGEPYSLPTMTDIRWRPDASVTVNSGAAIGNGYGLIQIADGVANTPANWTALTEFQVTAPVAAGGNVMTVNSTAGFAVGKRFHVMCKHARWGSDKAMHAALVTGITGLNVTFSPPLPTGARGKSIETYTETFTESFTIPAATSLNPAITGNIFVSRAVYYTSTTSVVITGNTGSASSVAFSAVPGANQYRVDKFGGDPYGIYTFNPADSGKTVTITYKAPTGGMGCVFAAAIEPDPSWWIHPEDVI